MLNALTPGLRIVSFRTFTSISETPATLQQVKSSCRQAGRAWTDTETARSVEPYRSSHRNGRPGGRVNLGCRKSPLSPRRSQKYAYAAEAGTPSAEIKARYFDQYLHSQTIQEDWITQSLHPFNSWNHTTLTEPYLMQALNELPDIKPDAFIDSRLA
jgi:aminopeptidase N